MSFDVKIDGIDKFIEKINTIARGVKDEMKNEFTAFAKDVERDAKRFAPANEGHLRQSINSDPANENMQAQITAATNYAAYVEFGTRRFAAEHIATLPADWRTYAATFKGKTGGSFDDLVVRLVDWVKKRGLHRTEAVSDAQTGERFFRKARKSKAQQAADADQVAYAIAIKIMREGSRPHPFLYPAITLHLPALKSKVQRIINK